MKSEELFGKKNYFDYFCIAIKKENSNVTHSSTIERTSL